MSQRRDTERKVFSKACKYRYIHALQVVSQHALQVSGGWYPSMPCRSPGLHPGGEVEGSGQGAGVSRPTPSGKLRGLARGRGSPGPHPEGSPGPHPGESPSPHQGVSRPTPGGLQAHTQAHTWRVSRPTPGGIPACTEVNTTTLPQQTVCILLECILVSICICFDIVHAILICKFNIISSGTQSTIATITDTIQLILLVYAKSGRFCHIFIFQRPE